ncbi:polyadenylate-binding protein 1-like [Tachysurus fulvidraco]|uniref:polyadenylate-binding protein 1-like n=1 Tax=Tachysurus fulvidraco TaxID=1234273 RepID=UPI001FEF7727|nr:polyadenylate-binding protein 1-like [Tachysurus fulvidraco]
MAALYVGDLHPEVTELMIFERFRPAGPIKSVHICRDRKSGYSLGYAYVNFCYQYDVFLLKVVESKGYGYVQFESQEAAASAIKRLNGMLLNDQYVTIEYFKYRDERKPEARPQHQANNLFIKNLDYTIDDKCLCTVFGEFGTIISAKVTYIL